jgi:hypothetical protein
MLKSGEASLIIVATDQAPSLTDNTKDGMPAKDCYYFNMPAGPDGLQYNLMGGSGYWFSSAATDEEVIAALEYMMLYESKWVQEWDETNKANAIKTWTDNKAKEKAQLYGFPVYNAPWTEEYNKTLLETAGGNGELYNFDTQFGTVWEQAQKVGAMHPEEECDCQNLYQELTNIMQELSVNPEADVAALVAQADANYADLLVVAQGG